MAVYICYTEHNLWLISHHQWGRSGSPIRLGIALAYMYTYMYIYTRTGTDSLYNRHLCTHEYRVRTCTAHTTIYNNPTSCKVQGVDKTYRISVKQNHRAICSQIT